MKKNSFFRMLAGALVCVNACNSVFADTYDPLTDYKKGDVVDITINGVQVPIVYMNEQTSSHFTPSTPYDANNAWLWRVSSDYDSVWIPFHYVLEEGKNLIVQYGGKHYQLLHE